MASRPSLQPASIPALDHAVTIRETVWYVDNVLISVVLSSILTRSMRSIGDMAALRQAQEFERPDDPLVLRDLVI